MLRPTRSTMALLPILTLATACIPLPIPHDETITPAVRGTVLRDDGAPLAAARVAAVESGDASSCAAPGGSAVTDSLGRFRIPAVRVRRRILWLTLMESFGMTWYSLCAEPADSAAAGAPPLMTDIVGSIMGDTVACLAWGPRGVTRLTCDTERRRYIRTGGAWTGERDAGTFRLIVTPVHAGRGSEYHVFVQWVALGPDGRPGGTRATVELPAPAIDLEPFPRLTSRGEHWVVVVKSNRPGVKGNDRFLAFELGRPGELTARPPF